MNISVSELNVYPVKSCAGIPLWKAELDQRGIKHDREFMIVEAQNGKYVTQRQKPRMALIQPALYEGLIELRAPNMPKLEAAIRLEGESIDASVRDIPCKAVDQGPEAARWVSRFIGGDYRLVRMAEDFIRPAGSAAPNGQVSFADAYPLLVVSEESLADLNARIGYDIKMNRFRPNIVIKGSDAPYIEDKLSKIRINGIDFDIVKPCVRCNITLVEQESAKIGKQPLASLNEYRRNSEGKVEFAQNAVHKNNGTIRIGDTVEIIDYKKR